LTVLRALLFAAAALAGAAAAGGAGASTAAPAFAARAVVTPQVSSNWSGYALVPPTVDPMTFEDVTGTWVQPKATCSTGRRDGSAFWVGLGGYAEGSPALEQLGTAAECDGTVPVPHTFAWWEIVPASAVPIPIKILPGDTITAAVLVRGQTITFSLRNVTRHVRFSKIVHTAQTLDLGSAEWIAEAPSECTPAGRCTVIPLTNFGTVTFTKAAAIGNGHPGTILDDTWNASPIELIGGGSRLDPVDPGDILGPGVGAGPASVTADGRGFSGRWQTGLTPPAAG
jgi:hypothetical protein